MSLPYPPSREDGARVLDEVSSFVRRYVVFPTHHAFTVIALWIVHTHAPVRTWYVTPRLILDSAEPGSGKTRVLELLALLVRHPEMTISATVAAIFRMLGDQQYTLLFDEVDAIFNPKNGGNYEDLRALLNAGYKQGSTIARCVGDAKNMKVERFSVFAPVALAGLAGKMPATITTRAITIHMRRRAPSETVQPYRERDARIEAELIHARIEDWVGSVAEDLQYARPQMPDGVEDRPAEVWEALLAVADAAGGDWPERARDACRYFVVDCDPTEQSLGVRLLQDLRDLFTRRATDRLSSAEIVAELVALDEAPWADLYGKPLDQRRLARELRRYGVQSDTVRMPDGKTPKGYLTHGATGLHDAWARYLPESAATNATAGTSQVSSVADQKPVADASATLQPGATPLTCDVGSVADVAEKSGTDSVKCSLCGLPTRDPLDPDGRCPHCVPSAPRRSA